MADMELVLVSSVTILTQNCYIHSYFFNQPEKKNPSLTPMDWVQFIVSVVIGLVSGAEFVSFVPVMILHPLFYFVYIT
jgi:hypothetical protein